MAFRLVHVRYDEETKRAYVELRDADNNGGEMLATAVFSFRTRARLSKREIEQDVIRKAKYFKIHAFHYTPLRTRSPQANPIPKKGAGRSRRRLRSTSPKGRRSPGNSEEFHQRVGRFRGALFH